MSEAVDMSAEAILARLRAASRLSQLRRVDEAAEDAPVAVDMSGPAVLARLEELRQLLRLTRVLQRR